MNIWKYRKPEKPLTERHLIIERRILMGFTGLTLLGFLLEIIAVSTDSWLLFYIEGGLYQNKTNRFLYRIYNGLWRICKVEWIIQGDPTTEGMLVSYPFRSTSLSNVLTSIRKKELKIFLEKEKKCW